ncbi:MAG TPA: ATP-binding protein [Thermoanaerobaculaceae bacterium]|nr:ATP-binding protein [Thermoanaerobaculaceae bacterium]HRS14816.1 ATP-binding protein [Thermoanaerobaculaceae bacterium]
MTSALPSRRFREATLLIGAALLTLVAMIAVEMGGVLGVASLVEEETQRTAAAAAQLLAASAAGGDAARHHAALKADGWGMAVLRNGAVEWSVGEYGPAAPVWWPWRSREDWEASGGIATAPLALGTRHVVVASQPLTGGGVARVVVPATRARTASRWRTAGAVLALVVGAGGALLAWRLITRALGPYRELLAEAVRIARRPGEEPEDRFLVATFKDAVRRLEVSEADARQRVDELEVLTQVLTREASFGVLVTDTYGAVQAFNPPAHALVGEELRVGGQLPAALQADGRLRLGERLVEVRRFPLLASNGASLGHLTFLSDRTSLEALERALAEREQMAELGELSAGMAHELRNALATIRGYLRLLPDADEERRARFVAAMEHEARELGALLDRFLRFAQPHELQRQRCDLAELVAEIAGRVAASCPGVVPALELAPCEVEVDRMAVGVIIENLLRNAQEAVGGSGTVRVHTEVAGDRARVVVEDDGPGVSSQVAGRLFRPFVSTKPSGGLGLAMSRRLARLHGGDVVHEPRLPHGARFVLTLPLGGPA